MDPLVLKAEAERIRASTVSKYTLAAGIGAFAIWLSLAGMNVSVFEDAMITLRFSLNLAEYGSWSFNPDTTPVQGATSFLWMLLNAALLQVLKNPLDNVQMLGFWFSLSAFVLFALAARRIHPCMGLIALVMIWRTPDLAEYVYNGYETPLLWFFECLILYLLVKRVDSEKFQSYRLSVVVGFLLALSAMTRPEAILLSALIVVWALPMDKIPFSIRLNHMLVAGMVFVTFTGLFYGLVYSIYGLPFPSSYYLKVQSFGPSILTKGRAYLYALFMAQPFWLLAFVILLPIGRRLVPWRFRLPSLIGISVYTFFILYVGGDHAHNPGFRFFLFMVPFWWFAVLAGLAFMSEKNWGQALLTTIAYVSAAALCVSAITQVIGHWNFYYSDAPGMPRTANQPVCKATIGSVYWGSKNPSLPFPGFSSEKAPTVHDVLAVWLLERMGGPYTLASESAGHLAYYSGPNVEFIDLIGLGTYECIEKIHGTQGVIKYVQETRPDVFLLEIIPQGDGNVFEGKICNDIVPILEGYKMVAFVPYSPMENEKIFYTKGCVILVRSDRLDRFADLKDEGVIREFPFAHATYKLHESRILDWADGITPQLCESVR